MSSLLQQAHAYAWLDSTVMLLAPDGRVHYMNPAASRLDSQLAYHRDAGPDERGILLLPVLGERLTEACAERDARLLTHTFFQSRNIEILLTFCLRPVINQDTAEVEGALLTIGEEQLAFDRWHLARLQADMHELREQVMKLSLARVENERLIRMLLAEMPVALILFDEDRKVVQMNRAAELLFGTLRRTALGMRCDAYLDCFAQAGQCCPVLDQGQRINMDEVQPGTRTHKPLQLLRTAVALSEGGQNMVLEAFIDNTDRKNAEARLTQYREELENTVAERTARLEQTVEELEAFSYTVSHDLRSPLRAIDGFSQLLLDEYGESLDEVAAGYLTRSRNAAQRMSHLIDDLLNLSRISRVRLNRQQVDLSAIGEEVAGELRAECGEREVLISVQSGLRAQAEPGLVRAVLVNLMNNAWKFTASRPDAAIEVGATRIESDTVFYVCDNGEGFSMQYASKLFLPFHVLEPQSPASGTGIGLATVQRIIHRHGGSIWTHAEPGAGATFFFTLEP
jgi:signal transduction histidine kinase